MGGAYRWEGGESSLSAASSAWPRARDAVLRAQGMPRPESTKTRGGDIVPPFRDSLPASTPAPSRKPPPSSERCHAASRRQLTAAYCLVNHYVMGRPMGSAGKADG